MKGRYFIFFGIIIIMLAGCANTPNTVNIQATIDAAVQTAVAPYQAAQGDFVTVDMLATSQYEQSQAFQGFVDSEIEWYLSENSVTPEASTEVPLPGSIVDNGGVQMTATPSAFNYDNTNCVDRFEYLYDLTIADGMTITPRTVFEKKWYIKNTGTCTWNSNYKVTYMSGDTVYNSKSFQILQPGYFVRPGESAIITAAMTAPEAVGRTFTTYWAIESDNGEKFGAGDAKNVYLSSSFRVETSFNAAQNFGSLICADSSGYITCGNRSNGEGRGAVYYDDTPLLENTRSQGNPAIAVIPPAGENTMVRFEFGPLRFPRLSWFYTNFCCRPDTPHCDVTVRLYVRELGYTEERLILEDREWNDGFMSEWKYQLDDISIFDQDFTYILEVQTNGGSDGDDLILFTNTKLY